MARSRDRHAGAGADPRELEVLDPITGEAVAHDVPAAVADEAPQERGRRRRRAALGLALASVVCAGAAVWFGVMVWSLRSTEQVWAEAMVLDGAREAGDQAVEERLTAVGNPANDAAGRQAIRSIGEETARRLLPLEARLRDQRIADDRVSALRDLMLEALRFRRFQLSAERGLLGDTPLRKVETELDIQLERFDLARSQPARPVLASVEPALDGLDRFADEETTTVLVAWSLGLDGGGARELLHIDIDASTITRRTLPRSAEALLAADDLVVVSDGRSITAYPLDPEQPAAWSRPRRLGPPGAAVAGRPGSGVAMWVWEPEGIVAVDAAGQAAEPVPFPERGVPEGERRALLADTDAGLLIDDPAPVTSSHPFGRRGLLLVDRATGQVLRTIETNGRFAGASSDFVAVQLPGRPTLEVHRLSNGQVLEIPLPRTDAGPIVQDPNADALAFAAGPVAGNIASTLYLEFSGPSWDLMGAGGPRATVRPGTMAFAPSGHHLFWVTPPGRLAVASEFRGPGQLRVPLDGIQQILAFPRQG